MRQPRFGPVVALPLLVSAALVAFTPAGALTPLAAQEAQVKPAALPAAREIIDRYIREIGGRKAILGYSSAHVIGTASMPAAGLTGKMEIFHAKPNKFLQRISLPGIGDIEEGFDGTVGWTSSALTGPILFEGKQLQERAFDADFYGELKAPERYASMTTVEKTTFDEKPVYKVKLVKKGGGEDIEFYDVETGLKAGSQATRESPMGPMTGTTSFSDYKKFGMLRALEYDTVDPAVFALPPQIKALIK
jgi:hypothetical protein